MIAISRRNTVVVLFLPLFFLVSACTFGGGGQKFDYTIFMAEPAEEFAKAAAQGKVKELEKLLSAGVDINVVGRGGITPLFIATSMGNKKSINWLLAHGANPNVRADSGKSAIYLAVSEMDNAHILGKMLEVGGNPNYVNPRSGKRTIHSLNNSTLAGMDIRNFSCEIESVSSNGQKIEFYESDTLLDWALYKRNKKAFSLLISSGVNLNYQDCYGKTILHKAANLSQYEIVYLLLTAGADYQIKSTAGYSIIWNLENNPVGDSVWRQKVVEFLQGKGVEVNVNY